MGTLLGFLIAFVFATIIIVGFALDFSAMFLDMYKKVLEKYNEIKKMGIETEIATKKVELQILEAQKQQVITEMIELRRQNIQLMRDTQHNSEVFPAKGTITQ